MKWIKRLVAGNTLRHWRWTLIGIIIGLLIVLAVLCIAPVFGIVPPGEVFIGIFALILGLGYFLQQQHMEQARFFRELFTEFNNRYDLLNNKLFSHLAQDAEKPFEAEQQQDFMDYFNLCAEERLFYKAGYIYEDVWRAWCSGMKQFSRDPRVAELWRQECETESYYDFDFIGISKAGTEDSH